MNIDEVGTKLKELFSRGSQVSKEAFEKAGDKVQDFTDKSVTKLEIHKLETKRDCKYEEMGLKLSQMLLQGAAITCDNVEDINITSMKLEDSNEEERKYYFTAKIELTTGGDYGYTFRVMPKHEMLLDAANLDLIKWITK